MLAVLEVIVTIGAVVVARLVVRGLVSVLVWGMLMTDMVCSRDTILMRAMHGMLGGMVVSWVMNNVAVPNAVLHQLLLFRLRIWLISSRDVIIVVRLVLGGR